MNLGEKIKHYREGLRWTLEHLSDLSGVEKGTISALEVRKSKRSEFAGKIAAAFGLSVNQLLGDQDFLRELKAGKRPIELESNRDIAAPVRAYAGNRIWVIGNGQGGLPDRIWTDGDHPVGASDKYAEVATDDDHAFVVCVRGDSMIPRYQPGEYALVEPDTAPEIEDDVLVRLESGETMLKRLLSRRGGIRLGSYNSAEVMTYRDDEITWIYYVSHPIPARKIKHWVKQQEYEGEERRHHSDTRDPERRSGYVLPEPKSEMEHVYGRNLSPGERAHPVKAKRRKS